MGCYQNSVEQKAVHVELFQLKVSPPKKTCFSEVPIKYGTNIK